MRAARARAESAVPRAFITPWLPGSPDLPIALSRWARVRVSSRTGVSDDPQDQIASAARVMSVRRAIVWSPGMGYPQ